MIGTDRLPPTGASRALVVNVAPQCLLGLTVVLRGAGYVVEFARRCSDALALVAEDPPDVLVLGFAPADGESVELCVGVRCLSDVPILILCPVGARREMARALNAGADEYVPTPFRRQELIDRLGRLVVPALVGSAASSQPRLGKLVIDLVRKRVTRGGAVLLLEPAEFELIRVLAQHCGRLVTDGQLLRAVWGDQGAGETLWLRITVARLRAKLEWVPWRSGYLVAEPGLGYRLCAPAEVVG
jgi:two-component system KDP operon response regulator KdpE